MRGSVCVLSGGTGTPKLLQGLVELLEPEKIKIVANTADDLMVGDLYISPDIDSVLYTLACIIDPKKWYGIAGDTYSVYEERRLKGISDILRIGDEDRRNAVFRTNLLKQGRTLSYAVKEQCRRLGIYQDVWPMTDSKVTTKITTPNGVKEFQEFWVGGRGRDEVLSVEFDGIETASISQGAKVALEDAELVIIGPSNPITSIGPIVKVPGVIEILKDTRVVAISPIKEGSPFSGPAGKMLLGLGYEVSPASIALIYSDFLDELIIDRSDGSLAGKLSARFGIRVRLADLEMRSLKDKFKLAQTILATAIQGEINVR